MSRRRDWYAEFREFENPIKIRVGNGEEIMAFGEGDINVETFVNNECIPCTIYGVLYAPTMNYNLFFVKTSAKKGIDFSVKNNGKLCVFTKNECVVAAGVETDSLYVMKMRVCEPSKIACNVNKVESLQT